MKITANVDADRFTVFLDFFDAHATTEDVGVLMTGTNSGIAAKAKRSLRGKKFHVLQQNWLYSEDALTSGLCRRSGMGQLQGREYSFLFSKTKKTFLDAQTAPRKYVGLGNTTAYPEVSNTPVVPTTSLSRCNEETRVLVFDTVGKTNTEWADAADLDEDEDDDIEETSADTDGTTHVLFWLVNHPAVCLEWLHQLGRSVLIDFTPGDGTFGTVAFDQRVRYVSTPNNIHHSKWLKEKWNKHVVESCIEKDPVMMKTLDNMIPPQLALLSAAKRKATEGKHPEQSDSKFAKKDSPAADTPHTTLSPQAEPTGSSLLAWEKKIPPAVAAALGKEPSTPQRKALQETALPSRSPSGSSAATAQDPVLAANDKLRMWATHAMVDK